MPKNEEKTIIVPVVHGAYPLREHFKETFHIVLADYHQFCNHMTDKAAETLITAVTSHLPTAQKFIDDNWGSEFYMYALEVYSGTDEQFRREADAYVDYFIPFVYESGGDGTHFDELPSAVDEFIHFCALIDYLTPIQRLYDSLFLGPPVHLQAHPRYRGKYDEDWNDILDAEGNLVWRDHSAYYPPNDDDPGLYRWFENVNGIKLHKDHPKD